jgi:hypothetical protein
MFTKTTIALTVIVAIASSAVAAEKRQPASAYGRAQTIVECAHGTWDAYALRCDAAD